MMFQNLEKKRNDFASEKVCLPFVDVSLVSFSFLTYLEPFERIFASPFRLF